MTAPTTTTPPVAAPAPGRHRALALAALAVPTLLIAIDIAVMGVALPSIARALDPSAAELLWIADAYNYLVAGSMLTMGAVADRFGRRRTIVVCAAVFALESVAGAFAPTAGAVIVARAAMGVSGSAIMPASMSLIGTLFTEQKARIQAMGAYMTVFLVGMAVAPFVGGLLLAHFWWGSVFLVGAPVMLVTMVAVPLLVPEGRSAAAPRIDVASAVVSLGAVLCAVYALKTAVNDGAGLSVWVAVVAAAVLGVGFVRRQRRLPEPLVDLALLARPQVARTLGALFLTALVMGGSSLFLGLYLQEVQGFTPLESACWTLPQIVLMIAAANLGPWLNRRLPARTVITSMMSLLAVGFGLFALAPSSWIGAPIVAVGGGLATFGIGAAYPLLMDGVIRTAPPERAGAGAALAQVSNELGIALGLTVLGSLGTVVYRALLGHDGPAGVSVVDGVRVSGSTGDAGLLDAVRDAFTGAYNVVGLIGLVVALVVLGLLRRTSEPA